MRGIRVAPECRCTPYDRDDYDGDPPSVEVQITERLGGMWSPYDLRRFGTLRESDIEHIIATSEGHDSGLCAASDAVRRRFASDLDNLTIATPDLNRHVAARKEYGLTIDRHEADALDRILTDCDSFEIVTRPSK